MKAFAVIALLAASAGGYAYMHPEALQALRGNPGGSTVIAGDSAPEAPAPSAHGAMLKCVNRTGQTVYSNKPCGNDETEQSVHLSSSINISSRHSPPPQTPADKPAKASGNSPTGEDLPRCNGPSCKVW